MEENSMRVVFVRADRARAIRARAIHARRVDLCE